MAVMTGYAGADKQTNGEGEAPQLQVFVMALFFVFGGISCSPACVRDPCAGSPEAWRRYHDGPAIGNRAYQAPADRKGH